MTLVYKNKFRYLSTDGTKPDHVKKKVILPKEHNRNLYDIDEEVVAKAMILAKKMVNKLTKVLDCDGYNIVQNNEECAGQSVFHFHMHLIPRYKGDQVGLGWKMGELSEEDKKEILDKMK